MTEFASTLNSPAEERALLASLVETFEAVDVTGLSAWERARAVHGRTAAGLAEGADSVAQAPRAGRRIEPAPPSVSPVVQTPLFEEAA